MGESAPLKMAPFVPFSQMRASPRWTAFPTLLNAATMLNPTEMGQMAPRHASPHSQRARCQFLVIPCLYCPVVDNELIRTSRSFPLVEIHLNHSATIVVQFLELGAVCRGKATSSGKRENTYVAHDQRCRSSEGGSGNVDVVCVGPTRIKLMNRSKQACQRNMLGTHNVKKFPPSETSSTNGPH
jgi:hypothetical protein